MYGAVRPVCGGCGMCGEMVVVGIRRGSPNVGSWAFNPAHTLLEYGEVGKLKKRGKSGGSRAWLCAATGASALHTRLKKLIGRRMGVMPCLAHPTHTPLLYKFAFSVSLCVLLFLYTFALVVVPKRNLLPLERAYPPSTLFCFPYTHTHVTPQPHHSFKY